MKKFTTFACLALALVFALNVSASEREREWPYLWGPQDTQRVFEMGNDHGKAAVDTFLLMGPTGSGAPYIGDFETANTLAGNGWSSADFTAPTVTHWQLSDYQQLTGDQGAWCGDLFPRCTATDSLGGYGNEWNDLIVFKKTVANPGVSTLVEIDTNQLQVWTEPTYDFVWLSYRIEGELTFTDLESWDGNIYNNTGYTTVDQQVTYTPADYIDGTDIEIYFRFTSDTGWSDEDCAGSVARTAGAVQLDDVTITLTNGANPPVAFVDDFESGWGNWVITYPDGCGDFTQLWEGLEDFDPCRTNYTRQAAWIDDGSVTGQPTEGFTWQYGPNGYIVNNTGGLLEGTGAISTFAISPVMDWQDPAHNSMFMAYTVYRHEDLSGNSPGMIYSLRMRSADTSLNPITDAAWQGGGNFYGGPDYGRFGRNWTAQLEPGADQVQIGVGARDFGDLIELYGTDGTPAPYFDNIRIITYAAEGPLFAYAENGLAQDNFPEIGTVDNVNLAANSVRFDQGFNIAPPADERNDPGDSLNVDILPQRAGGALASNPEMHWVLQANPVFNSVRSVTPPNPVIGWSDSPDGFAFDLPDTGFLFPGDRLQYYFKAVERVGGDPLTDVVRTLPGNIDNWGDFSGPLTYNTAFEIHCLPTVTSVDAIGDTHTQPTLLFWNDFFNRGGENEWFGALTDLGLQMGVDYDAYWTNRPDNGAGNGIGGRTEIGGIEGYTDMLYSAGDLGAFTFGDGNFEKDAGQDIQLVDLWLFQGGRDLFMTGDDLAYDIFNNTGALGQPFVENLMGISYNVKTIQSNIGGQTTPTVVAEPGNPVFQNVSSWVAYGGCLSINTFDGVTADKGATRLAQFADPNGNTNVYSYSAASLNIIGGYGNSRIISMPYDFLYIWDDPNAKVAAPKATRTILMSDVLNYFGVSNNPGNTTDVPAGKNFAVFQNEPNPFNPFTTIKYVMPRTGHMTMKVYNVRGQLVKTLIDGVVAEGNGEIIWDGTNNQGGSVSSGVYFYETRTNGTTTVNKMALVK